MTRGKRIHDALQKETNNPAYKVTVKRPIIEKKIEAMMYRYYYYSRLQKLRYTEITKHLELDFFISDARVSDLLSKYANDIKRICEEGLTVKQLAEKFPNYNWPKPLTGKKASVVFINVEDFR